MAGASLHGFPDHLSIAGIFLPNSQFFHFAEVTKYFLSIYILVSTYLYVNFLADFHLLNHFGSLCSVIYINFLYFFVKAFFVSILNLISIYTFYSIPFYFYFITSFIGNFNTFYLLWCCYSSGCCRSLCIVICCRLLHLCHSYLLLAAAADSDHPGSDHPGSDPGSHPFS